MFAFVDVLYKDFNEDDKLIEFFTIMTNFTHGK